MISFLITTYNSGKYLYETIESAVSQTINEYDIHIIDGGSTDNTVEIIKSFDDDKVVFHQFGKANRSAQLNYGIKNITTEYIAILDSDDIPLKNRLETQKSFIDNNSEIDIVGSNAELFYEDGRNSTTMLRPFNDKAIRELLLAMNGISFGTCLFKRELFINSNEWFDEDLKIVEDHEWLVRVLPNINIANVQQVLMRLRQSTVSRSRGNEEAYSHVRKKMLNTLSIQKDLYKNKSMYFRNIGLVEYYYGNPNNGLLSFIKSFLHNPLSVITLRYLLSSIIPNGLLLKLKQNKIFINFASSFRKLYS